MQASQARSHNLPVSARTEDQPCQTSLPVHVRSVVENGPGGETWGSPLIKHILFLVNTRAWGLEQTRQGRAVASVDICVDQVWSQVRLDQSTAYTGMSESQDRVQARPVLTTTPTSSHDGWGQAGLSHLQHLLENGETEGESCQIGPQRLLARS